MSGGGGQVPVYDIQAERGTDGYLRVIVTAETPTSIEPVLDSLLVVAFNAHIGSGALNDLVRDIRNVAPDAEILLFGVTDSYANIHGPNERVLVAELEKAVLAETLFFHELATRWEAA